jgi:hypothetical protein
LAAAALARIWAPSVAAGAPHRHAAVVPNCKRTLHTIEETKEEHQELSQRAARTRARAHTHTHTHTVTHTQSDSVCPIVKCVCVCVTRTRTHTHTHTHTQTNTHTPHTHTHTHTHTVTHTHTHNLEQNTWGKHIAARGNDTQSEGPHTASARGLPRTDLRGGGVAESSAKQGTSAYAATCTHAHLRTLVSVGRGGKASKGLRVMQFAATPCTYSWQASCPLQFTLAWPCRAGLAAEAML